MSETELLAALQASVADPTARALPYVHHRFIGSGDIAAVAALYVPEWQRLTKWSNASDVWLRLVHGISKPSNGRMQRGLDNEKRLRELYRATVGEVSDPPGMQKHPRLEWAAASPDGLCGAAGVGEWKTHSSFQRSQFGEPGTDQVADKYLLQGMWLLEVTGRQWVNYLVSFGRDLPANGGWVEDEVVGYTLGDDPVLRSRLVDFAERFFHDHVIARVAPAVMPVNNRREFKRLVSK